MRFWSASPICLAPTFVLTPSSTCFPNGETTLLRHEQSQQLDFSSFEVSTDTGSRHHPLRERTFAKGNDGFHLQHTHPDRLDSVQSTAAALSFAKQATIGFSTSSVPVLLNLQLSSVPIIRATNGHDMLLISGVAATKCPNEPSSISDMINKHVSGSRRFREVLNDAGSRLLLTYRQRRRHQYDFSRRLRGLPIHLRGGRSQFLHRKFIKITL